ncbi:MAG: hypothetical protein ACOZCL_03755 [Bacillota bacterium]
MVKKGLSDNKLRVVFILLILLFLLIPASVAFNRSLLHDWSPQEPLLGKWIGQSEVFLPSKNKESSGEHSGKLINIEITIKADGKIIGTIGDAELVNCTVKQNRSWFERLIGMKTDYIINGGYLRNGIVQEDAVAKRVIRIPFDITDGELKGSIFEIESWNYPYPIFPRFQLKNVID